MESCLQIKQITPRYQRHRRSLAIAKEPTDDKGYGRRPKKLAKSGITAWQPKKRHIICWVYAIGGDAAEGELRRLSLGPDHSFIIETG